MVGIVRPITEIDMIASVLIIVVSLVLAGYWFRYTCILLLRAQSERSAAQQPTFDQQSEPDELLQSLERDYRMLTYLCQHGAGLSDQSFEERLLIWDFQVMRFWYRLTRSAAPSQARRAVAEMAAVVGFLAQKLGGQADLDSTPIP
jgi:hypothetical protein